MLNCLLCISTQAKTGEMGKKKIVELYLVFLTS